MVEGLSATGLAWQRQPLIVTHISRLSTMFIRVRSCATCGALSGAAASSPRSRRSHGRLVKPKARPCPARHLAQCPAQPPKAYAEFTAPALQEVGDPDRVTAVIPWLLSNGGLPERCKLDIQDLGENRGRGLVAREAVAPGEVLLSVPFTHVFMENQHSSDIHWSSGMAVRLLKLLAGSAGTEADACLRDWALSLPPRIDTPPIQYSEEELNACRDVDTLEEATSMRALHKECSMHLEGEIQSLGFSEEDYSWAVSVLHSRCFCIQPGDLHVAVPGIDMANHSFTPNAGVRVQHSSEMCQGRSAAEDVCEPPEPEPSRFELVAGDHSIGLSEEVTISYGGWPNDLFYLLFGFVPAENPHDSVVLFRTVADAVQFVNELSASSVQQCLEDADLADLTHRLSQQLPEFSRVVVTAQGFDARLFEGLPAVTTAHTAANLDPMFVVAERCKTLLECLTAAGDPQPQELSANMRTSKLYQRGKVAILENALNAMGVDQ
mmetsp:Transcript_10299/g.29398  ORF Transcript_10299/g.29398 Transcript_10299/m.29398 type:complete len:493 (+) Transcript_10299:214-1692(+)